MGTREGPAENRRDRRQYMQQNPERGFENIKPGENYITQKNPN